MSLFDGLRVVEVGGGIPASYATKFFADYGADVIKVEPPEGDAIRRMAPFVGDRPGPDRSALFLHTNTNKRSVVLDTSDAAQRSRLGDLMASADIVVESLPPGTLASWGLGFEYVHEQSPRLVVVSITPFGQDGPYAGYAGSDIVLYAMGGPMISNGTPDREPLKLGGYMSLYQIGNLAATAAMAALLMSEQADGGGVHVDVSGFEAQLCSADRRTMFLLNYAYNRVSSDRTGAIGTTLPNGLMPTADGYVQMVVAPQWIPRMLATVQSPELDDLFARAEQDPTLLVSPESKEEIDAALYPWLLARTKQEVMDEAQSNKWPVMALKDPVEVLSDEHFRERGFFVQVPHPVLGEITHPGAPFRVTDGWQIHTAAPALGEHTADVFASLAGVRRER